MRARIFFLAIWGIKHLEAYREISGDFVCPLAPLKVLDVLDFDSNNRVIWQNLWNSNTRALTLNPLFAFLRFSNML